MTDDAAQPPRPEPTEPEAAWDHTPPPVATPSPAGAQRPTEPEYDPGAAAPTPDTAPPGPDAARPGAPADIPRPPPGGGPAGAPPPGGGPAGAPPPGGGPAGAAFGGAGFTSRYGLVRPRDGRYLAGVCAAVGRATNTDPVLWRVLLAVLGFFGGVGVLVYVAAWLIIPGEGDSASPVESMLGRGRSSMSPVTVIVLSVLVAVGFGFIVTDAFRAVLLGAAILVGGALLLNRQQRETSTAGAPPPAPPTPPTAPVPPVSYPAPMAYPPPPGSGRTPTTPAFAPYAPMSGTTTAPGTPSPGQPDEPTRPLSPPTWPTVGTPAAPPTYRPPFAPHGPYAGPPPPPPPSPSPSPAKPKAPKKPRERSALGAVTFSLIFVALGLVVILDLLGIFGIGASAYFAAALAVIGLGLLVGTWFGRARWLIALGLVTAVALGVATVADSYDRVRGVGGTVTWAPTDHRDLAVRYEQSFADALLDLRAIDFDQQDTEITVVINFGEATVVVPPNVDVTVATQVTAGDANVFGERRSWGMDNQRRETVDLGADGAGGGKLRLNLQVNAGHMEVTR
ncbi:PspC domain-containing protein [Micromonospora radicis]|uniref:PspC domain-containing protein n=1 Tax=Micromonospora radicis TaxID=1894971 RepID=A0A418MVW8_9ACTN|nr:PspC domain-containing protein [Micromonospora radicis]RIV38604.1 PspC domain-containing protein [Micromonospora radicis]